MNPIKICHGVYWVAEHTKGDLAEIPLGPAPTRPRGAQDRGHLAVPARAGEVGHDPPVPQAPPRPRAPGVRPPGPAPRAPRDVRRDRLPRAGHADPRRGRRLLAHGGRLRPSTPRP